MTAWHKYSTNIYEVGIDDASTEVPQERSGMMALSSNPQFIEVIQRKKHQLGTLKIDSWAFITEGKKQKTAVYLKFNVKGEVEEDCEFSFRVPMIQEGKLVRLPLPDGFLQPNGDKELRRLAASIAEHVSLHISSRTPYDKHPSDIAMDRISFMLQNDYATMRERIRFDADTIRLSDEVRQKATDAYYVSIRDQLQKLITAFPGVPPEELHRMIDEIVCVQTHNE